ncbi:unnamed protein product [Soboliphyme baturini]|uniref:DUF834 domain-containing protein n=1 Tax=Soboliphyme baturini TaxID=241478 RepID=A0A183IDU7_9BILA|nr:unnamed protein product [Soboliphyme baturini]
MDAAARHSVDRHVAERRSGTEMRGGSDDQDFEGGRGHDRDQDREDQDDDPVVKRMLDSDEPRTSGKSVFIAPGEHCTGARKRSYRKGGGLVSCASVSLRHAA